MLAQWPPPPNTPGLHDPAGGAGGARRVLAAGARARACATDRAGLSPPRCRAPYRAALSSPGGRMGRPGNGARPRRGQGRPRPFQRSTRAACRRPLHGRSRNSAPLRRSDRRRPGSTARSPANTFPNRAGTRSPGVPKRAAFEIACDIGDRPPATADQIAAKRPVLRQFLGKGAYPAGIPDPHIDRRLDMSGRKSRPQRQ